MNVTKTVQVAAGGRTTCSVSMDGSVACWGDSSLGELGSIGTYDPVPRVIAGVSGATRVAVGNGQVCAVVQGGAVLCWGANSKGELGHPSTESCLFEQGQIACSTTAQPVVGLSGAVDVVAGFRFTCARTASAVLCWGDGYLGQLGVGTATQSMTPMEVKF
jgi:alpha-tubulin suppressor-like RCC1 family protein